MQMILNPGILIFCICLCAPLITAFSGAKVLVSVPRAKSDERELSMAMFGSGKKATGEITIRRGDDNDIRRVADFLAGAMYEDLPRGQKRELSELENIDLRKRYGEILGKDKLPKAFFVAEQDGEIIGSAGIDGQIYSEKSKKFRMLRKNESILPFIQKDSVDVVALVLANLAIRRDMRKKGLARKLVTACVDQTKEFQFDELYLLVDSRNTPAQNLYKSAGFKLDFEDDAATCVASGNSGLVTEDCINYCYVKSFKPKAAAAPSLGSFFGSIFGPK